MKIIVTRYSGRGFVHTVLSETPWTYEVKSGTIDKKNARVCLVKGY